MRLLRPADRGSAAQAQRLLSREINCMQAKNLSLPISKKYLTKFSPNKGRRNDSV